jgi:hypothetical protein
MKLYDKLCSPAKFYLLISIVSYIFIILQNIGNGKRITLGTYSCNHSNPVMVLVLQALYILFWTWVLNLICKINPSISWVIVLLPFILFFLLMALVLIDGMNKDRREGYDLNATF